MLLAFHSQTLNPRATKEIMKTYYLIPIRTVPKFEINEPAIQRMEDTPKAKAEASALSLERQLNGGKSQEDIWAAYKEGDFSVNPCEAWRVDVSTFSQSASWARFAMWPCNKEI